MITGRLTLNVNHADRITSCQSLATLRTRPLVDIECQPCRQDHQLTIIGNLKDRTRVDIECQSRRQDHWLPIIGNPPDRLTFNVNHGTVSVIEVKERDRSILLMISRV
jgi:hypothetical protein